VFIVPPAEGVAVADNRETDATVAVPQIAVDDLAVERNVDRIRERVTGLPNRVDIAVFPEYALTGFVADERIADAALAREAALDRLSSIAEDHDVAVVAGYAERDETNRTGSGGRGKLYNATAYVPASDGAGGGVGDGEPAVYRKRHLWGDERELVTPGTERVIVDTPAGSTGLLTCYDLNFVGESAWFTDRAVDALFVSGAWPAAHAANWRLLLRARALDGVRWVVGAGRTGVAGRGDTGSRGGGSTDDDSADDNSTDDDSTDDGAAHEYAGNSLVAGPNGQVVAELGRGERDLIASLDRETLDTQRELVGSVGTDQK